MCSFGSGEKWRRKRWAGRAAGSRLDLDALMTQELDAGPPMNLSTPITPEKRLTPQSKRVQQDTHLARLVCGASLPLALRTFRARATIANAGGIDHTEAAPHFSTSFMGDQHVACWTTQRAIGLERKVGSCEAASFPGGGRGGWSISRCCGGRMCGGVLVVRCKGRSEFGGAQRIRMKLMSQFKSQVPDPLGHQLPALLPQAEWLHHLSGPISWSSSESVDSKAPRWRYNSTTSQTVNACCGRVVKKIS
jgi:hypothetical protein